MTKRIKPNIFILGPSGSGKSTSLRNLNQETTAILNLERKALPFRGAGNFKQEMIENFKEFRESLLRALGSDKIEVIIIESFTTLTEYIYIHCRTKFRGFDIWDQYATEIYNQLFDCKGSDKYVVFLGIPNIEQDENNQMYRAVKVEGKKMKGGAIEKEFVMVLETQVGQDDAGKPLFYFRTITDGFGPAKTPMGMFDKVLIPNDLNYVIEQTELYYKEVSNNEGSKISQDES